MLKSIQAKLSLTFLLSFLILHSALAQSPVQVIPSVLPPYSTLLSEYYNGDQTRLSVTLLNTDAAEPFLQGYLRISIEGQGVKLQSVPFGNYPTIDLMSGSPVTLSQSDFAPYFSPQNLQGQGAGNQNRLPEGFYQFCFEVLEKNTGRLIGSKQCAQAYLQLNDPAVLIQPERGKVISYTNPFNLLFQWTPRHLNLINTEYEFTLVEVWDEGIDPQAAFFTAQPIYRTTTTTPNLFYGPAEPQLLMGKKYAWRVKTKVTTSSNEQEPFKNEGNSEVFWFKLQGECPALQRANIVADPRTNKTTLSWVSDPQQVGSVHVDYRKKGTSRWNTVEATGNQVSLTGLAWSTDYEYQLGNRCIITNDFAYGSLQSFRTLSQDTNNCVPSLPKTFSNQEPLAALRVNDTIYASDFTMRLTSVTGANGNFSGEGYLGLIIPTTTTLVAIKASFSNITVNTDHQVIAGRIVSQYDATESNILDVDPIFSGGVNTGNVKTGETSSIPVGTTIDPNITASIETHIEGPGDTTYTVTVKGVDGTPVTVTTKKLPVTVQDEQGKIYSIDKDGKITLIGQSSLALLGGKTAEQLNKLDLDKGMISFQAHEEQVYGLDLFQDIYGTSALLTKEYEKLNGGDYRVGNKLLITGSTDKINASINNLDRGLSEDSIHFVTGKGIEFASKKTASGTYEITLLSGPADDAQELYAIYRDRKKNQTYSLGKLKVATYEAKSLTVNLVPVGDARVNQEQISERLNKIYNKVGVSWTVNVVDSMKITRDWDIADFNRLNITGAGKYNSYSEEMKLLNAAYIAKGNVDPSTPYLFVFKQSPVAGPDESGRAVLGDMLRNKQFGYLFLQGNSDLGQVVAHELGHGRFHLPHTFDGEISLDQGDLSDNLMDYDGGTEFMKLHWDGIYSPGVVVGAFEGEGDGASTGESFSYNLLDPAGRVFTAKNSRGKDINIHLAVEYGPILAFDDGSGTVYEAKFDGSNNFTGYKSTQGNIVYKQQFVDQGSYSIQVVVKDLDNSGQTVYKWKSVSLEKYEDLFSDYLKLVCRNCSTDPENISLQVGAFSTNAALYGSTQQAYLWDYSTLDKSKFIYYRDTGFGTTDIEKVSYSSSKFAGITVNVISSQSDQYNFSNFKYPANTIIYPKVSAETKREAQLISSANESGNTDINIVTKAREILSYNSSSNIYSSRTLTPFDEVPGIQKVSSKNSSAVLLVQNADNTYQIQFTSVTQRRLANTYLKSEDPGTLTKISNFAVAYGKGLKLWGNEYHKAWSELSELLNESTETYILITLESYKCSSIDEYKKNNITKYYLFTLLATNEVDALVENKLSILSAEGMGVWNGMSSVPNDIVKGITGISSVFSSEQWSAGTKWVNDYYNQPEKIDPIVEWASNTYQVVKTKISNADQCERAYYGGQLTSIVIAAVVVPEGLPEKLMGLALKTAAKVSRLTVRVVGDVIQYTKNNIKVFEIYKSGVRLKWKGKELDITSEELVDDFSNALDNDKISVDDAGEIVLSDEVLSSKLDELLNGAGSLANYPKIRAALGEVDPILKSAGFDRYRFENLIRQSDNLSYLEENASLLTEIANKVKAKMQYTDNDLLKIFKDAVNTDFVKSILPTNFTNTLKTFGKTEDEIVSYFKNYHNVYTKGEFFTQIENVLTKNNLYNLTQDEAFALWGYTTNFFYRDLNIWSREGSNISKTTPVANLIRQAMQKVPKYNGKAYRALEFNGDALTSFLDKYGVKGKEVTFDDFLSAGSTREAAFFNKAEKNVRIIMEVKDAPIISSVADGIKFRGYSPDELLLNTGRKFLVEDIYHESGVYYLKFKQIQ